MKSVLISIRPEWVEKIAGGEKTIEVRKSAPKEVPFKAYIYATRPKKYYKCGAVCTSDELLWLSNGKIKMCDGFGLWADGEDYQCVNGKVIGEFICDKVERFSVGSLRSDDIEKLACLSYNEMICYFYKPEELDGKTAKQGFAWHISDLKIYDKPKELSEFYRPCSYSGICYSCNRFRPNGTPNDKPNDFCDGEITRPPQSYMFVEEVEEQNNNDN